MNVRDEEVIEHASPVIPAKHIYPVIPGYNGMLASFGAYKLLATGEFLPFVEWFPGVKVQSHVLVQIQAAEREER